MRERDTHTQTHGDVPGWFAGKAGWVLWYGWRRQKQGGAMSREGVKEDLEIEVLQFDSQAVESASARKLSTY